MNLPNGQAVFLPACFYRWVTILEKEKASPLRRSLFTVHLKISLVQYERLYFRNILGTKQWDTAGLQFFDGFFVIIYPEDNEGLVMRGANKSVDILYVNAFFVENPQRAGESAWLVLN